MKNNNPILVGIAAFSMILSVISIIFSFTNVSLTFDLASFYCIVGLIITAIAFALSSVIALFAIDVYQTEKKINRFLIDLEQAQNNFREQAMQCFDNFIEPTEACVYFLEKTSMITSDRKVKDEIKKSKQKIVMKLTRMYKCNLVRQDIRLKYIQRLIEYGSTEDIKLLDDITNNENEAILVRHYAGLASKALKSKFKKELK